MSLSLADDRGLHARELRYEVDITQRDLHPAFDVMSNGTSLLLDARASVVGPLVARDSVVYEWSWIVMEPTGETVVAADRTLSLLREKVQWRHSATKPIHEVPLSDLGLDGEHAEIRIRLEMTAQGMSASTARLVPIEADGWKSTVFERVRQAAGQAPGVDLKPAFRSGVGDLTLRVGSTMSPLQLPAASGGDGELTHSIAGALPPGLRFSARRQITGTPSLDGAWEIRYQAVDQDGDVAELRFRIRVLTRNAPDTEPELPPIEGRSFRVGERVFWTLPAASSGDDPKTYNLQGTLPPDLRFDLGIRRLSGTTTQAGTYPLRYEVRDRDGDNDVKRFLMTVIGDAAPPSGDGWIDGNWQYASTHEGSDLSGDRLIEVTYQFGVYTIRTTGRGVDTEVDADGDVTCTSTSGSVTLDLRGYPPPGGFGPDDFLRMFHCGEHLGEDQEACDIFVFSAFSDEQIELEATVGGVPSTYTYTKYSGRSPRLR